MYRFVNPRVESLNFISTPVNSAFPTNSEMSSSICNSVGIWSPLIGINLDLSNLYSAHVLTHTIRTIWAISRTSFNFWIEEDDGLEVEFKYKTETDNSDETDDDDDDEGFLGLSDDDDDDEYELEFQIDFHDIIEFVDLNGNGVYDGDDVDDKIQK